MTEEHCCQVSPRFLGQFEKKIRQNTEQVLHSHISIFEWFGKELFFNQTKSKTPKIYLLTKLPLQKLKIVRQYFPAPFLPLLAKIGGRTATNFPRPKDIFSGPFWVILQNFRPPGSSAPPLYVLWWYPGTSAPCLPPPGRYISITLYPPNAGG